MAGKQAGKQNIEDVAILSRTGKEMKENPPRILTHTRNKFGAERAEKQRKAILLSKARRSGASVPRSK